MKAIVVWGSTTGNTQRMAEVVAGALGLDGWVVDLREASDTEASDLLCHDLVLLGCSTWGSGELQEDFEELYDALTEVDFGGRPAAVFGPGDSSYDCFCKAVDMLAKRLAEQGAKLVAESFKVDGEVDAKLPALAEWAALVARSARS